MSVCLCVHVGGGGGGRLQTVRRLGLSLWDQARRADRHIPALRGEEKPTDRLCDSEYLPAAWTSRLDG